MSYLTLKLAVVTTITAYLIGEGYALLVPLATSGIIGLSSARQSWFRVTLLSISILVGIAIGTIAQYTQLSRDHILLFVLTWCASVIGGIGLGLALKKYSWARCILITTGAIFIVSSFLTLYFWDQIRKDITITINARIAEVEQLKQQPSQTTDEEASHKLVETLKYIDYHWEDFHLGLIFGQSLIIAITILALMIQQLHRYPSEDGIHLWENPHLGRFADVRPSDYLVWLAIGSAIVILYDSHYGVSEITRIISRNMAVGLSFIYWMNGLGILLYTAELFQWNVTVVLVVVIFVFGIWSFPLLATIGFFDTWGEFRNTIKRIYEKYETSKNMV